MNFQNLKKIEKSGFYLDLALRKARLKSKEKRNSIKNKDNLNKSKSIELSRIETFISGIKKNFNLIIASFPSIDELDEFYYELIACFFSIDQIKKSLASLNWAVKRIESLGANHSRVIKKTSDITEINKTRRMLIGRASSILKQIDKHLVFLETVRQKLRSFPSIKTSLFTAAITGFPNVGKSTLLNKLTSSNSKIATFPFTTKGLMMGYLEFENDKIQLIDTPGTLDRTDKKNPIEKTAELAMKYCAHIIIFIFDLSHTYPIEKQIKLYEKISTLGKQMLVYISKDDIYRNDKEFCYKKKKIIKEYGARTDATEILKDLEKLFCKSSFRKYI